MPKIVDHDERRREIGQAVARIAAAEGLEAVSMRRVAAEAGMSTPLVQHYFPDKNTMLRHALTDVTRTAADTADRRVRAAVAAAEPEHPVPLLRSLLDEFLPLDDERRTVQLLHMAFFTRALSDPELASYYRETFPLLTEDLAELVREQQRAGRTPAGIDPEREIDSLLTLGIALGTDMLLGSRTAESAAEVIDYHLRRLFPDARPRRGPATGGRPPPRRDGHRR